jgi:hypothetical protein
MNKTDSANYSKEYDSRDSRGHWLPPLVLPSFSKF